MLFDGYRKQLNFSVTAFNLEKLNSDTMRVATFIAVVNKLSEDGIDHHLKGKAWDGIEELCEDARKAYSALAGAKDNATPDEVRKKYSLCMEKLQKERLLRISVITELKGRVSALRKELFSKPSLLPEEADSFTEKLAAIRAETESYCGEHDRALREYALLTEECNGAEKQIGTEALGYYTKAYKKAVAALRDRKWTEEVLSEEKKAAADLKHPASAVLSRYASMQSVTAARMELQNEQQNLTSLISCAESDLGIMKELQKLLEGPLLKELKFYSADAENAVIKCADLWKSVSRKSNFDNTTEKRIGELQALIRNLKQAYDSDQRVADLNRSIKSFCNEKMTASNYTRYLSTINSINGQYKALTADEKNRVVGWSDFQRMSDLYDKFAKKSERKAANAYRWDTFKDVFLNWLSTVWIPVLVAGVCVGLFFLMRASWYSNAPDWLLHHSVKLWGWRNWGSGTAFGVTNALYNSDIFILFKIILYIFTVILDLLVYLLQAIWWLLSAISWPIRWGLSRLLGLILYGLAYGLPGLVCVGACIGIGFCNFTYEKYWACHIVNMILCVGITAMAYVAIFVF